MPEYESWLLFSNHVLLSSTTAMKFHTSKWTSLWPWVSERKCILTLEWTLMILDWQFCPWIALARPLRTEMHCLDTTLSRTGKEMLLFVSGFFCYSGQSKTFSTMIRHWHVLDSFLNIALFIFLLDVEGYRKWMTLSKGKIREMQYFIPLVSFQSSFFFLLIDALLTIL